MSGIDEQKNFAPECPKCKKSKEWNIGEQLWLFSEAAMERRKLLYPIACYNMGGPGAVKLHEFFTCISCRYDVVRNSELEDQLLKLFYKQQGKPYHRNVNEINDIGYWK